MRIQALIEIIVRQADKICQSNARVEEPEEKVRDLSSEAERLATSGKEVFP